MPQQVYPLEDTQKLYHRNKKLTDNLMIHAGFHPKQPKDVQGSFKLEDHSISLGSSEKDVLPTIWHETTHKILIEMFDLKHTIQFDKIASEIERFLFPEAEFNKLNYYGQTHPDDKQINYSLNRRK